MNKYYFINGKRQWKYNFNSKDIKKLSTQKTLLNKKQIAFVNRTWFECPDCNEDFDRQDPDCYCNTEKHFYIEDNRLKYIAIDLAGE